MLALQTAYAYDGDGNISSLETKAGETIRGKLLEERRNGASVSYAYDKVLMDSDNTLENLKNPISQMQMQIN